jgi:antitoxin component of MazEF toxin-antitoxin module
MKTKPVVTKVSKWGNGYGIRVPVAMLSALSLSDDSEVIIESSSTGITISPRELSLANVSLESLLAGVTPALLREGENAENLGGRPQGREIW